MPCTVGTVTSEDRESTQWQIYDAAARSHGGGQPLLVVLVVMEA